MLQITLYFWQMCLLRVGPDKVPSSLPILLTALAVYLVVAFVSVNLIRPSLSFGDLCGSLAVEVLIEGCLVYGILWLKKHRRPSGSDLDLSVCHEHHYFGLPLDG